MNEQDYLIREIIEIKSAYSGLSVKHWLKYEVFTWVWWVSIFFTIAPLLVWWRIVDRKRMPEIVIFGFIIGVQASFLDVIGSEFALWEYPIRLLPHALLLVPVDLVFMPVIFMLIYQYCKTWHAFLIGSTIVAATLAFILEPLAVLMNQYVLIEWRYIYSFPIYILAPVIAKLVTERILRKSIRIV